MPHILIFDIETCHNRPLMDLYGYKTKKEDEFAPIIFHVPCAIAVGDVDGEGILRTVTSLCQTQGFLADDPVALTQAFWTVMARMNNTAREHQIMLTDMAEVLTFRKV